jgi:hypothetical protein
MVRDDVLIRGVGYIVIHASHLEREIEEVCRWLAMGVSRSEHHETKRVSDKIKWCKCQIREINSSRLDSLDKSLDKALNLLDKRNRLVHEQILFAENAPEKIVPSKLKDK